LFEFYLGLKITGMIISALLLLVLAVIGLIQHFKH